MSTERAIPILFSTPMVKAILEGRKTQTRRVIKPQPIDDCHIGRPDSWKWGGYHTQQEALIRLIQKEHPFGRTLWVRETHKLWDHSIDSIEVIYKDESSVVVETREKPKGLHVRKRGLKPWRPSIFMPRWASRITLKLKGVRVQRLQDISDTDARAEGADKADTHRGYPSSHAAMIQTHRQGFINLWDSINAKRGFGWDTNCFVWAIEFEKQ